MDSSGTFTQLARELSSGERKNLLQKLRQHFTLSREPLYMEDQLPASMEEEYGQLPWYYQIGLRILSFFASKPPEELYQEREIAKMGRAVGIQMPGIYNYPKNLLLAQFYQELVELKESARFFYKTLDGSVNNDKGAFYAFLVSLEMEDIHNALVRETDPALISEKNPAMIPVELRRAAFRKLEDAINMINDDQRTAMYADIRFLFCLKKLAAFPFDRLLAAFGSNDSTGAKACSAAAVRESLSTLNNILFSLKKIPSMSLFESLFIFYLQDQMQEPGVDPNREIEKLLTRAEHSLFAIRRFNQMVPLTLIARCASRNLSLSPVEISGGEDWLVIYREYWKRQIEDRFSRYLRAARSQALQESCRTFFNGINLKLLENIESEANPGGIPVKAALCLAFLRTYHSVVFAQDNEAVLLGILLNGEFYSRDNQIDFLSCYNEINQLEDKIAKFDYSISPSGEFGLRYESARKEMSQPMVKRRKMQTIVDEAAAAADQIFEQARAALISLVNLLNGILKKDETGMYGALANFTKIAGRGSSFTDNLNITVQNARTALKILEDITSMEMKQ
jgi:hypothetical protein